MIGHHFRLSGIESKSSLSADQGLSKPFWDTSRWQRLVEAIHARGSKSIESAIGNEANPDIPIVDI